MQIALYHRHYDEQHLDTVKAEMQKLGVPTIKAIWSECYGMWMAVEGCHRIRAAKDLGLTPNIEEITSETVIIQIDGDDEEVETEALAEELQDGLWQTEYINF